MEFLIDSIDIDEIKELIEYLPITGVTSNPSIVKQIHPDNFFDYMRKIYDLLDGRELHVQVIGTRAEEYIDQAKTIVRNIDPECYIKVPATFEGIKAMKILRREGYNITATAVYEPMQAIMALEAKADYIAPYVNRIENLGGDPYKLIKTLRNQIDEDESSTKILGASFKNIAQIRKAADNGAQSVTVSPDLLRAIFNNQNIISAVDAFNKDWFDMYHRFSI